MHRSIVVQLPIDALEDETGHLKARRIRRLLSDDVKAMVRTRPIRFVIANPGYPLRWMEAGDCYDFWAAEVHPHLPLRFQEFAKDYRYDASEWVIEDRERIVLLEMRQ